MKNYTIGIDFGSLSARAVLVDTRDGKEIATAESAYAHGVMSEAEICGGTRLDTTALQDPADYLDALGEVTRGVLEKSGISPDEIGALAIDFTASNVMPILADGTPLATLDEFRHEPHAYVKMWKHHGANEEAARLTEVARERYPALVERYGGIISSEWFFSKLYETYNKARGAYERAERFIEAGDWITMMLTGCERRSACLAGYKALWSASDGYPTKEYLAAVDPGLCDVIGTKVSGDILPLGASAGEINEYGARITGLNTGTPVSVALIDAHAALPAAGAVNPGDLMIIVGTSACHILISDVDAPARGICGKVKGGVVPEYLAYEAGQTAVGDALAWVVKNATPESYSKEAAERGVSIYELLTERAAGLDVGESGLIALDWWNGNRSPYADYDLSGVIIGITLKTTPEEIFRAVVESIAFGTRRIVEEYKRAGIEVKRIIVSGGIANKNAFIMQTLADVLGAEILVSAATQAGALGSAIYAAVTAGAYATVGEAASAMANTSSKRYLPSTGNGAKYDLLYREYVKLAEYFHGANDVMKRLKMHTRGDI